MAKSYVFVGRCGLERRNDDTIEQAIREHDAQLERLDRANDEETKRAVADGSAFLKAKSRERKYYY